MTFTAVKPDTTGVIDKYIGADGVIALAHQTGETALFTANAAGTTTTIVGAAASLTTSLNCARIGERFVLVNSAGALKENKIFKVTAHNGTTTVTFSPAAAAATASGDRAVLIGDAFSDDDSMDARLLDFGGVYTQAYLDKMTQNDKIYAIRQLENPDSVK